MASWRSDRGTHRFLSEDIIAATKNETGVSIPLQSQSFLNMDAKIAELSYFVHVLHPVSGFSEGYCRHNYSTLRAK
jgi:hypothetical protein